MFLNRFGEGTGNNSRLKRQQIGEGASVQGNGGNLRSTNHFAVLGAVGFDVDGFAHDRYFFGGLTDLELYVHAQSGVDVDHQTSLPVELESRRADLDVVGPDRQRGEIIEPLGIRGGLRLDTRLCFNGRHSCCDHDTAVWIRDHAGDAAGDSGPGKCGSKENRNNQDRNKPQQKSHRIIPLEKSFTPRND